MNDERRTHAVVQHKDQTETYEIYLCYPHYRLVEPNDAEWYDRWHLPAQPEKGTFCIICEGERMEAELTAANKRIAELEAAIIKHVGWECNRQGCVNVYALDLPAEKLLEVLQHNAAICKPEPPTLTDGYMSYVEEKPK